MMKPKMKHTKKAQANLSSPFVVTPRPNQAHASSHETQQTHKLSQQIHWVQTSSQPKLQGLSNHTFILA